MDLTDGHALRARVAETYEVGAGHPLEYVHLHEHITEHADADTPPSEIARRFGVGRNRARSWVHEGRTPPITTTLDTLADRGLFGLRYDDPETQALNTLVSWLCAVGTLRPDYQPLFSTTDQTRDTLLAQLDTLGIEPAHVPDSGPGSVRVEDGNPLGRLFAVLGAPRGTRSTVRYGPPAYLYHAPREYRERFCATHLFLRGNERRGGRVHITVQNEPYRYALAGVFWEILGANVLVHHDSVALPGDVRERFGFEWTE